jgi:hypothetical protein
MSDNKPASTISPEMKELLHELQRQNAETLRTVVEEMKKPAPKSEAEIAQIKQDQASRLDQAQLVLQTMENKKREQRICTHKRPDSSSACVLIPADGNSYHLCQLCQAKIRPGVAPTGYTGSDFYDTDLFQRILQEAKLTDF